MNRELKSSIEKLEASCSHLDTPDAGLPSIIERDLVNYISYLSASDGVISDEEVQLLREYFDKEFTPSELSSYIEDNGTYSTVFESTVPEALKLLVALDTENRSKAEEVREAYSEPFIHIVEQLGKELLSCDGYVSPEELSDYEKYLELLRKYRAEKLPEKQSEHKTTAVKSANQLTEFLEQLNQLIGLDSVKSEVSTLIHLQEIQHIRRQRGLKEIPISKHLVFYGNPGTGKTTVARLLARIYQAMGALSKGHLVETERSGLVGGYVGQTAIKTKKVIESAVGGVLFIDEAYSLTYTNSDNDYGKEAIDTLLKAMEDYREDLVVIVAGYPDLMKDFVNSNPGLRSRFNKYIEFPDYTPEELVQIFQTMCDASGYTLSEDSLAMVSKLLTERYEKRTSSFANGRDVRNLFEKIISNQANRLFGKEDLTDEQLREIVIDDVAPLLSQ